MKPRVKWSCCSAASCAHEVATAQNSLYIGFISFTWYFWLLFLDFNLASSLFVRLFSLWAQNVVPICFLELHTFGNATRAHHITPLWLFVFGVYWITFLVSFPKDHSSKPVYSVSTTILYARNSNFSAVREDLPIILLRLPFPLAPVMTKPNRSMSFSYIFYLMLISSKWKLLAPNVCLGLEITESRRMFWVRDEQLNLLWITWRATSTSILVYIFLFFPNSP